MYYVVEVNQSMLIHRSNCFKQVVNNITATTTKRLSFQNDHDIQELPLPQSSRPYRSRELVI